MTDGSTTVTLPDDPPTAVELLTAVRAGDVDLVRRLLSENPDLAEARLEASGGTRTALHVVTDWPGYFPNGPDVVRLLIDAGADPNAATTPAPPETPLHWAASSDVIGRGWRRAAAVSASPGDVRGRGRRTGRW